MRLRAFLMAFAIFLVTASSLTADEGHHHLAPNEKLGKVSFPISCPNDAQKSFEHALALLHSFEYESAQAEFAHITEKHPKCAMAYWGQAMSLYHQLWTRPSQEDLARGNEWLQKGDALQPKTQRERDYIAALQVFFKDGDKTEHRQRALAYSDAMQKIQESYPSDREAAVFYALSLIASSAHDDPEFNREKKAIALLNKLFEEAPDHPGIAHYLIHSCEAPQLAPLGLAAARRYASIAPSSPHALHMPSHVFAHLGLWKDDIESNQAALDRTADQAAQHLHVGHHRIHSMDYLEYAFLQTGDNEKAKQQIARLATVPKEVVDPEFYDYYNQMRVRFPIIYAMETRNWKDLAEMPVIPDIEPYNEALIYWARAVGAGHLRNVAAASKALDQFKEMVEATKKSAKPFRAGGLTTDLHESQAWLDFAEGRNDDAVQELRGVADRQEKFGKGELELPAREMLADLLLEVGRAKEALAEYETALRFDPNRFNGLYGAARAAEGAPDSAKAQTYYSQLMKNAEGSNGQRAELAQAKAALSGGPVASIGMNVADMQASAKWYEEKLGMKRVMEQPKKEYPGVIVLEGNGLMVELVESDEAKPVSSACQGTASKEKLQGVFKAGAMVDDFDGLVAVLRSRNVPIFIGPFPKRPGQRANMIIKDNEGNLIQFFGK